MENDRPSAPDPEQLPLGMHEGVPLVEIVSHGPDDSVIVIPVREPPVAGEWSYDDAELEEPRFVAKRVDGVEAPTSKATPVVPIRTIETRPPSATPSFPTATVGTPAAGTPIVGETPSRAMRPTLEALRLAFEQTPGDTTRAVAYVAALEKKGDTDTALKVLDGADGAGADPFAVLIARASVLGARLKYDEAERTIAKAAKLKPDAPEVLIQTGILACRRARWKDAVAPLIAGIERAPDHVAGHYFAGEALNHSDDLKGALAAYQRAAELEPDHWRALKGVGIVLDRLGRSAEAAPYYRRARDAQRGA